MGSAGNGQVVVGRRAGRRSALPSGRAVMGGFLVAVAAVGTYAAQVGAGGGPRHRYVVAARDITAGTVLSPADLTSVAVDLPDEVGSRAFDPSARLPGAIALTAIHEGELVQASALADASRADPRYEVSLPLERSRALAGTVVAGEVVDVLATYGSGSEARTVVVTRRAQVVTVDDGRRSGVGGNAEVVLVLAITSPDDVLAVAHAAQAGDVTLVRATGAAASGAPVGAEAFRPDAAGAGS